MIIFCSKEEIASVISITPFSYRSHIKRKWKALKAKYYGIQTALNKSGSSSHQLSWRHFTAMDELLATRPRSLVSGLLVIM